MTSPLALRRSADRTDRTARLAGRVGLAGVLASLDREAVPCEVPGEAAGRGFTWDAADRDDPDWNPQGVAAADGGRLLLVAWYARTPRLVLTAGVRVSVVDRSDPERPRYAHVRLVVPTPLGLRPVRVHAGGLALAGDLLLVADTVAGLRAFALADALRRDGELLLPQRFRVRPPWLARRRLRFSFVSADGDRLTAGEYRRAGARPRLVRWPLPDVLAGGWCLPVEVHEDQPVRAQGAAVHDGTWWLSASAGPTVPGDLHVGRPGAWRRHRGVLPPGPEDLSWAVPGEQLWCATEWPGARWVFPVDARRWAGPG